MSRRNVLAIISFLMLAAPSVAQDSQRHVQAGDMNIYLGIVPAQLTVDYPRMHGGVPLEEHSYHLVVALFDSKSGKRITKAAVKATVSPLGQEGETIPLELMQEKVVTFGNYVTLDKPEHYRIKLKVQRDKDPSVTEASFVYQRPQD